MLCQDSDAKQALGGLSFPCKCRPGTQKWCPCNGSVILIARAVILEARGTRHARDSGCMYIQCQSYPIHMLQVQHTYENISDVPPKTETSVVVLPSRSAVHWHPHPVLPSGMEDGRDARTIWRR